MKVPFAPDAVVFDLDGVLVDSEALWAAAEEQVVVDLGFDWDPALHGLLLGKGPLDAAAVLADHLGGGVDAGKIAAATLERAETLFAGGVPVAEGARELLAALHGRVPLAVATNSRRRLAKLALSGNGLDVVLDTVVTADDVGAHKPAPDPYLTACERIGARPRRTVGIEDSPPGIASAKSAGLWVVACLSDGAWSAVADHTVASLLEIDPGALLAAD